MDTEYRKGYVYVQNQYAGLITETDEGYMFEYDNEYIKTNNSVAVSLTLPLEDTTYLSSVLFPFFDGLIPEGWLLNIVSRNWKIDPNDRFGYATCRNCRSTHRSTCHDKNERRICIHN